MEGEFDLAALVEQCQEYFRELGVTPAWIERWMGLNPGDRVLARKNLDSWVALYLDACLLLQSGSVDQDAARDVAVRFPPALLHYAKMQRSSEE